MKSPRIAFIALFACALAASCIAASAAENSALMPMPQSIHHGEGELAAPGRWKTDWSGCNGPALRRAFERFEADYLRMTGALPGADGAVSISIRCKNPDGAIDAISGESYTLDIARNGIRIDADGAVGVLRALATLRQLVTLQSGHPALPVVSIRDAPRFAWRGVMLDVARHFIELSTLERQIDAMERVKLNVLHLHLSDDQGFRVESRRFPRLNAQGPYFTQEQVKHLVSYAADRGVLIVPEFDVPGHSRAMIEAYPELGVTATHAHPPFPPDVALNPASPQVYRFLEQLIGELAALFPGPYFHIGGDEVGDDVWADDAGIAAWMQRENLSTKQEVEGYFARRVIEIVRKAGKTAIGWEEFAATGIPQDAIVQAWQSSNATAAATANGHRTIVSAGYYLDLLMPADFHYALDPLSSSDAGFTPEQAERVRKMHPLLAQLLTDAKVAQPLPALTPQQESLVLGAEAPLWGEMVTDEMIDHRLWPRAAALAERFWSPAQVRDPADMYRRLAVIQDRLTIGGLQDGTNRRRMAARIAPGNAEPVYTLLEIVTPVRNMAHDHRILAAARGRRIEQPLNALADAAPADSLVARKFIDSVQRFLTGDSGIEAGLRAQLAGWRDNEARFAAVAHGNAMLEPALPTSSGIAALAQTGLDALDAIGERAGSEGKSWEIADALVKQAEAHDAASRLPLASFLGAQPPADLIIAITPGIRALIDAARNRKPPTDPAAVGMVEQPCLALPSMPASVREFNDLFLRPGPPNLIRLLSLSRQPEFVTYNEARKRRDEQDWAGLCRYRDANAALLASGERPAIVFLGDSITENWVAGDPSLFDAERIGRGISDQTTAQMLVRFQADVVALRPRTVHIMAGTNDVAGNAGPTTEQTFQNNIRAMVAVARANDIRVALASIPPAAKFPWRSQVRPASQIGRLNEWLRSYAAREKLQYVDYYSVLATADGAMKPGFSIDGVHPNRDAYAAMHALAAAVAQ